MAYRLGVDLGTTWSAAAIARTDADGTIRGRSIEMARLGVRTAEIPSVVALLDDDTILVGAAAERRAATDPGNVAREFKRRLGDPVPLIVGGKPRSAEALMGAMLQQIVAAVTTTEGEPPDAVVLTHPANWGPYKLERFSQVFQLGGLPTGQILAEPLAAAQHYLGEHSAEVHDTIVVFDFGGGTFDAAVLRRQGAGFELLGQARGFEQLGGIDFDEAILRHVTTTAGIDLQLVEDTPSSRSAIDRLRHDCVAAKETLSDDTVVVIPVMLPDHHTEVRLNRTEFEAMIRPSVTDAVTLLETTIAEAGLQPTDIDAVLLVGGTSRIPLVSQILTSRLNRPVLSDLHPKHAVAMGAAAHAPPPLGALADQASAEDSVTDQPITIAPTESPPTGTAPTAAEPAQNEPLPDRAVANQPSPPTTDPVSAVSIPTTESVTPSSAPMIDGGNPRPVEQVKVPDDGVPADGVARSRGRVVFAAALAAVMIGVTAIVLSQGGDELPDQEVSSSASPPPETTTSTTEETSTTATAEEEAAAAEPSAPITVADDTTLPPLAARTDADLRNWIGDDEIGQIGSPISPFDGLFPTPGPGSAPAVAWETDVVDRMGTVAGGGLVYSVVPSGERFFQLVAHDAESGELVWSDEAAGTCCTNLVLTENTVAAVVNDRGPELRVLERSSGALIQSIAISEIFTDIPKDSPYNEFELTQGIVTHSLSIERGLAIVVGSSRDSSSFLVAIELDTGETRWSHFDPTTTIVPWLFLDETVAVLADTDSVTSIDLQTGDVVWTADSLDRDRVKHLDGGILMTVDEDFETVTGFDARTGAEVWQVQARFVSDIASDGTQFVHLSSSSGSLQARDIATGELRWDVATSTAVDWGQLAIAGDTVYVVGRNGMVSSHALADGRVLWSDQVEGLGERDQSYIYLAVAEGRFAVIEDDTLRVTTST